MRCATFRLNRCERWKGWQLFCFCWTILVFCGTICKTVSVFSSHRIGTWKDHTEVLLEFLPKRDRWLELPFFAVAGIFCSPENKKIILSQKLIYFSQKKHLPYCSKWFCVPSSSFTNKWKRVLFGKLIQRSLEKGKIR